MKKELKNPKKADLNKDGQLSGYEKKRGMAIEEAMNANLGKFIKKKKAEKNFKKELKEGKVDIKGDKGGKKLSTYVMEKRNEPKIPKFLQRQKNAPVAGLSRNKNLAKVLGKAAGVIGILTPSELGAADLENMERKKYGGPVGVKLAKGGFKKKTPIY
jgi:hypothetical protein